MADVGAERLDSQAHPGESPEASAVKLGRRRRRRRARKGDEQKEWLPLGVLRANQNLQGRQGPQARYGDGIAGPQVHQPRAPADVGDAYQPSRSQLTPPDSPDGGVFLVPRFQTPSSPHHADQIEPALVPLPQDDPSSPTSEPSASATTSELQASLRFDSQSETAPETNAAPDTAPPSPVDGADVPEVIHKRKCRRGRRPGATCRLCNQSVLEAWRYASELESGKPLPRKTLHKLHQEHECPCGPQGLDSPATESSKEAERSAAEVPVAEVSAAESPDAVSPSEAEMPGTVQPVADEPSEAEPPRDAVLPSLAPSDAVLPEGHLMEPSEVTPSPDAPTDASNAEEEESSNEPLEQAGCMHCEHCKTQLQQHEHQQTQQRPRRRRRRRRRPAVKVAEGEVPAGPSKPQSGETISMTPQSGPQDPVEVNHNAAGSREALRASSVSSGSRQQTPRAPHRPTAVSHQQQKLQSSTIGGGQRAQGEASAPNSSSIPYTYPSSSTQWSPGLPLSSSPLPPLYRHLYTTPAWPQLPPALSSTGLYDPIWGPPTWAAPGQVASHSVQLPVRRKADPKHTYDPIYDPY